MKKIPQLFLLSTLSLGLVSPVLVKAETTVPTETTTTTTTESIPASDSNIIENTTTTTPETTTTSISGATTSMETSNSTTKVKDTSIEDSSGEGNASFQLAAVQVAALPDISGSGTLTDPYIVSTDSGFTTAISNTVLGKTTYITLANDINLVSKDRIIKGDTIINGNNNSIIFTSGYDSYITHIKTNGLNVTFKNINFGKDTNLNSSWYGFCTINGQNNILNIENVNYTANNGAQPFWTDGITTLNFRGNNNFQGYAGSGSQEFAEFQGTINFESGSNTKILHDTNGSLGFIYNRDQLTINVGDNAIVDITSGVVSFLYGTNTNYNFNIGKNSNFSYYFNPNKSGWTSSTTYINSFIYQKGTINIKALQNSNITFNTKSIPFQRGYLVFAAQDTAKIKFKNDTVENSSLYDSSTSLEITNNTANNTIYNFRKTGLGANSTATNEFVKPTASITKMTTGFTNYNSLVFEPAVKVGGVSSTGTSAANVSQVTSNLTGVSSALDSTFSYQAQYYISNSSTIIDDATVTSKYANASATPSNSTTHYDGSVYQALKTLPSTTSSTEDQKTAAVLDQLLSGSYTVYGRLQIKDSNGASYYTPWLNTAATINPYSSFVFPSTVNLNNSFTYQRLGGVLGLKFNQTPLYTISNSSNQIMDIKPAIMTPNSGNQVTLVSGSPGTNNDKKLQLKLASSTTTPIWNLADLTNPTILELQPYWDTTNNKKQFYFDGAYSGPIVTQNKAAVSYNLVFSMQPR